MNEIQKLEEELAALKKVEEKEKWEEYLKRCEEYLKSIVGKTFMKWYFSNSFVIFKVCGYNEQYYMDKNGFYGQWFPSRYFKLTSTKAIFCTIPNKHSHKPSINYHKLKFNVVTGKNKDTVETTKLNMIDYADAKYSFLPDEVSFFGKIAYDENKPLFDDSLLDFQVGLREAPEGMWEAAKKIADQNIIQTKEFWDEFEIKVQEVYK